MLIVGIGGFASNVGKTELVCELLQRLGWEAIKTTRGHYRSCGKDPHTCCVSQLLGPEPIIHSGKETNYENGKDTARYWDAGASNVHWVIGTDGQIGEGVKRALNRVRSAGVLIEGNSFSRSVKTDYFVMVVRPDRFKPKPSAKRLLRSTSALYLSEEVADLSQIKQAWTAADLDQLGDLPATVFGKQNISELALLLSGLANQQWQPTSGSRI